MSEQKNLQAMSTMTIQPAIRTHSKKKMHSMPNILTTSHRLPLTLSMHQYTSS